MKIQEKKLLRDIYKNENPIRSVLSIILYWLNIQLFEGESLQVQWLEAAEEDKLT